MGERKPLCLNSYSIRIRSWLARPCWLQSTANLALRRVIKLLLRSALHNRRTEVESCRLCLRVFVAQMPVHLANENPPVLVANPTCDGHVINSAHHGITDKMVPAIVEAKP